MGGEISQWMEITMATKLSIFLFHVPKNRSSVGHCKQVQQWFPSPAAAFAGLFNGHVQKCSPNLKKILYIFCSNHLVCALYIILMFIVFYFHFTKYFLRANINKYEVTKQELKCYLETTYSMHESFLLLLSS